MLASHIPESCSLYWVSNEFERTIFFLRRTTKYRFFVVVCCDFSASIFAAVFFIAASYAGCDQTLVVLFFTLSVGSQALTIPGTYVNPLDLSPNYVGPLTALVNGAGSITGILAPWVIGLLTPQVSVDSRSIFDPNFEMFFFLFCFIHRHWCQNGVSCFG